MEMLHVWLVGGAIALMVLPKTANDFSPRSRNGFSSAASLAKTSSFYGG
jgi:hypothetical protein